MEIYYHSLETFISYWIHVKLMLIMHFKSLPCSGRLNPRISIASAGSRFSPKIFGLLQVSFSTHLFCQRQHHIIVYIRWSFILIITEIRYLYLHSSILFSNITCGLKSVDILEMAAVLLGELYPSHHSRLAQAIYHSECQTKDLEKVPISQFFHKIPSFRLFPPHYEAPCLLVDLHCLLSILMVLHNYEIIMKSGMRNIAW